jgi:hypothetical protein
MLLYIPYLFFNAGVTNFDVGMTSVSATEEERSLRIVICQSVVAQLELSTQRQI